MKTGFTFSHNVRQATLAMFSTPRTRSNLRVFGGSSHPHLTKKIAKKVGVKVGDVKLSRFANRELNVQLLENVRGQDVYIIQTGGGLKPNADLMELMLLVNAFRLAACAEITVITPFFPYSKGDQKDGNRVPISCKLVADLLKKAGASYLMMLDPHTPQLEGFFNTPVDAVKAQPLFCEWIKHNVPDWKNAVVVSPDEGGTKKAVSVANDLNLDFALVHNRYRPSRMQEEQLLEEQMQRRTEENDGDGANNGDDREAASASTPRTTRRRRNQRIANNNQHVHLSDRRYGCLSGTVRGRTAIVIDDMIDTGTTLDFAAEVLDREGARDFYFLATHGVFAAGASEVISDYDADFLKAVVVSNSIAQDRTKMDLGDRLDVIDVSGLIAEFIRRHHYRESVSVLSQFMPIRDDDQKSLQQHRIEPEQLKRSLNINEVSPEDISVAPKAASEDIGDDENGDEYDEGDAKGDDDLTPAQSAQLSRLRKGFRLSSMCWDD